MKRVIENLSFCNWFIALSLMSSRLICAVACVRVSFPFKAEQHPWWVYPTFGACTHRGGHWGCLHLLATVRDAAANVGVQVSAQPCFLVTSFG